MVTAIIPNDSVFEKIMEEKPHRMKIELYDGGYSIIECYGIAKASPAPDGVIYSCRYEEEGFVYKGEAAYIWVGGKWIK